MVTFHRQVFMVIIQENGLMKTTMTADGPIPPALDPTNSSHPGMSFEGFGGGNLVVGDVRGNEHISLLSLIHISEPTRPY